jgi:hypothetical protein
MQEGEAPPLVLVGDERGSARAGADQRRTRKGQPVDMLLKDARVWGARQGW